MYVQIIMAVTISSMICFVLTITNVLPSDKGKWGYEARTDLRKEAIYSSPWFRVPYPGISDMCCAPVFFLEYFVQCLIHL